MTVQINMQREIEKLARADGLHHPAQLKVKIEMTQEEHYRSVIVAYWQGRDDAGLPNPAPVRQFVILAAVAVGVGIAIGRWIF